MNTYRYDVKHQGHGEPGDDVGQVKEEIARLFQNRRRTGNRRRLRDLSWIDLGRQSHSTLSSAALTLETVPGGRGMYPSGSRSFCLFVRQ